MLSGDCRYTDVYFFTAHIRMPAKKPTVIELHFLLSSLTNQKEVTMATGSHPANQLYTCRLPGVPQVHSWKLGNGHLYFFRGGRIF